MITFNSDQFRKDISDRIDQSAHELGRKVVRAAERLAPKKTGVLATSISYAYDQNDHEISFIVAAPYGLFVEYGTRYMRPLPYLRPALNEVGQIYGFHTNIEFTNVIPTDSKLLAHGDTFQMHKSLSEKQKKHVRQYLKPTSQGLHHTYGGKSLTNTGRSRLKVKRRAF